jgi:hypothetical protein
LLAVAIAGTIGAQATMNLMVVTGLAPTKGIALPFVSAGGSGLVITSLAAGVLINIARQGRALATEGLTTNNTNDNTNNHEMKIGSHPKKLVGFLPGKACLTLRMK